MRLLPEISRIVNDGNFMGENRPHSRITIEPYWRLRTTGESVGMSGRGPYRWWQHTNNMQFEVEIPNLKTIEIDRSITQEVASCNITIYNQWHNFNDAILPPDALDQLGNPGYFWFERGKNAAANQYWGQEEAVGATTKTGRDLPDFSWKNVIIPNGLIRTYQGYGGHGGSIQDAIDSGNIVITGVWLIDSVVAGTNGMLNIRCRDIGRLLIEQTTFPPLVPEDLYPLQYYPAGESPFTSKWGPQHKFDRLNRTEKGYRTPVRIGYHDSTVDHWAVQLGQSPNDNRWGLDVVHDASLPITVSGVSNPKGSYSIDPSPTTFAISVGNEWPTQPSAYDYWEYVINPDANDVPTARAIDEIVLHPWGGGYELYVSIFHNGSWYTNNFGMAGENVDIPYQWTGIDVGNDIPYVMKVNVPDAAPGEEKPVSFTLPAAYVADLVRLTFHLPKDSGVGQYRFRSGIRNVQVFNTVNSTYHPTPDVRGPGDLPSPYTFSMASHPFHGYWIGDRDGNIYGFGDAFNATADVSSYLRALKSTPTGTGLYALEETGRVHVFGDAQHYGHHIISPFQYEGMPSNGEFQERTQVEAKDIAINYKGTGYWVIYSDGTIRGFGDVGGMTSFTLPATPTVQYTEAIRSLRTGRRHWLQLRGSALAAHPKKMGFWASNGHGEIFSFGDAERFNTVGTYGGYTYGGLNQRRYNAGSATGFVPEGHVTSIEVTEDGDGIWVLFADGHIAQFGAAVSKGPTRIGDLRWEQVGTLNTDLPPEYAFYSALLYRLVRDPDGSGFWVLMANGAVGYYEAKFWGIPSYFGTTGVRWTEGNYTDYSDIVKDLLLWSGFLAYESDPEQANVYGNVETTGIMSDIALTGDRWDKKTVSEAIKTIREVVGYFLYIDEIGGANFVSPNWWRSGNFDLSGRRLYAKWEEDENGNSYPRQVIPVATDRDAAGQPVYVFSEEDEGAVPYVPVIDERKNLTNYTVTADGAGLRSQIIIGASEPNFYDKTDPTHGASNTAGGFTIYQPPQAMQKIDPEDPYSPPALRGIVRSTFWYNRKFTNSQEQRLMAELISLYSWFSQRVGSLEAPADPQIGLNDQIRIVERNTGDTYLHYVRSVKTSFDADSGRYTMALDTNWLGDSDNWVITGTPGSAYSPVDYALISKRVEEWALRNGKEYIGGLEADFIPFATFYMSFNPTMINQSSVWTYTGSLTVGSPGLSNVRLYVDDISEWLTPATITFGATEFELPGPGQYIEIGDIELTSDTEIPVEVTGVASSHGSGYIALHLSASSIAPAHVSDNILVSALARTPISVDGQLSDGFPVPEGTNWNMVDDPVIYIDGEFAIPILQDDFVDSVTLGHEGGAFPYTPSGNRYRLRPTITSSSGSSRQPGPLTLSDIWGMALRWHLTTEENSPVTTSMVAIGEVGIGVLLRSTGQWVNVTPYQPFSAMTDKNFQVYGRNWGVNRAGLLTPQTASGVFQDSIVYGYTSTGTAGKQFGQNSFNSDGSPSRVMAVGYGGITSYLAANAVLGVADATKNADVLGLAWWVVARVVGPDASESYYRMIPGLELLYGTSGGVTSFEKSVDDDGGLVGRARVLDEHWKYVAGTTCTEAMLEDHPIAWILGV